MTFVPARQIGDFNLQQADALDWLRELPSESVDLIVTDPPYESLEKHRKVETTTRLKHSNMCFLLGSIR